MPGELTSATRTPSSGRRGSLASGSAFILVAQIVGNIGFFVAVLLLARELSVAHRGVVAFATTVALVVPRVSELGIGSATTVLAAQREHERPALLANIVVFSGAVSVAAAAATTATLAVGGVGPRLSSMEFALVGAGMLATTFLDAGYAFLVGVDRLRPWTIVAGTAPWLYAGLLGAISLSGSLSVELALAAWALAHAVWGVAVVGVAVRTSGIARPHPRLLRETLRLGTRTWVGSLSRFLNFRLDQVLMGVLATQAALGLYATAVNLSEIALYLPGAVATAVLAAVAREHPSRRRERVLRAFRALLLLTAAVVFVGAIVGAPLLPLLFGDRYRDAILPYLVLLPGALGYVAGAVFSSALVSSMRPFRSSVGPLVSLVIGVALDVVLIPRFGAVGAAFAATGAFLAGGAAAGAAFRTIHAVKWREFVPRRADAVVLCEVARDLSSRMTRRG